MSTAKTILTIHERPEEHWVGDAFKVRSLFSYMSRSLGQAISPFLLLDYGAPREVLPKAISSGVGEHPHRGFETVTIAYQGEVDHRDSGGHAGRIGPGDVQWMTAASGVVHEEMLAPEFEKRGGTIEMAQLWVNLPAKLKMSKPKYQSILKDQIGRVELPDGAGYMRVIAGVYDGVSGPAQTYTPLNVLDVHLNAGHKTELKLHPDWTTLLAILRGTVTIGDNSDLGNGQVVLLSTEGDSIVVEAETDVTLLVLSGEPIEEPIVGYGPFVMNTREEIMQAMVDYQDGKMGHVQ